MKKFLLLSLVIFVGCSSNDCDDQELNSNRLRVNCISRGPTAKTCLGAPAGDISESEACLMGASIQCSPYKIDPYVLFSSVESEEIILLDSRDDRRIVFEAVTEGSRTFLIARYFDDPTGTSTLEMPSCN